MGQRRAKLPRRLTDETIDGKRRPAWWVTATVGCALTIDRGLAVLGMSRPILVVSGFWRSGTTWLQECLAEAFDAKTVFEPLSPMEPRRRVMLGATFATEDVAQAFVPGAGQSGAFWHAFEAAAYGHTGSRFSLSCRRNVRESFRTGVVVKDVRLHRNLLTVHERLHVPVVHIRRHPCAVIASLLAADWHWSFERISLLDCQLPQVDASLLRECDIDTASRLAAFWALHEREAASALKEKPWAHEMTYEAMVQAPQEQIEIARLQLGLGAARDAAVDRPSASIDPEAFDCVAQRRVDYWQTQLSEAEIKRIEHVVSAIYPPWRAHWKA